MRPPHPQRLPACLMMGLALLGMATSAEAQVTVILAGNSNANITTALTQLDITYTVDSLANPDPATYGLGAGDFIITSNNGGSGFNFDYTDFLNAGGNLIVVGGTSFSEYSTWTSLYFNITDNVSGWHTDGAWHNLYPANGLPLDYAFEDASSTYHVLALTATSNSVLYGMNDEGVFVAGIRYYNNGGSINFMALNLGPFGTANDVSNFTLPWLSAAFTPLAFIPEPSTYLLLATGLAALFVGRRRRVR